MTEQNTRACSFCHIVIPAHDLNKAKAFYESVFGWKVFANHPGRGYWFFESGNVRGAFDASRTPTVNSAVLVIKVTDMNATLEQIRQAGGEITQPRNPIGQASAGYDAYFSDPNGNAMGIYAEV